MKILTRIFLMCLFAGFFYVVPHSVSELNQKEENIKNKLQEVYHKIATRFSSIFLKQLLFLKYINKEFDRFDHYYSRVLFAKNGDKNS